MDKKTFNTIYSAMFKALGHLEDDVMNQYLYDELDRAIALFSDWYDKQKGIKNG